MLEQKIRASLLHFFFSLLLVMLVIGSILYLFFPSIYLDVTDYKEISYIILTVDLILGPLLTFIIFNPKKSNLAIYTDFIVIGSVQLIALVYGAFSLYQVHPVYVTFNIDRFTVITAKDAQPHKANHKEYKISKLKSGKLAYAKLPNEKSKQDDLLMESVSGGEDLDQKEEYYEPYFENLSKIISKSIDPNLIFTNEHSSLEHLKKINDNQVNLSEFAFLPINSKSKDGIIVLNKLTGEPVTTLDIDPWKLSKK